MYVHISLDPHEIRTRTVDVGHDASACVHLRYGAGPHLLFRDVADCPQPTWPSLASLRAGGDGMPAALDAIVLWCRDHTVLTAGGRHGLSQIP